MGNSQSARLDTAFNPEAKKKAAEAAAKRDIIEKTWHLYGAQSQLPN